MDQSGLAEFGLRAIGAVSSIVGLRLYAAINDNNGTTDGRIDVVFTGSTDNGSTINGTLNSKIVVADPKTRLSAQNATVLHKTGYTGLSVLLERASGSSTTYQVASSGSADFAQELVQLTQANRSPGPYCALVIDDIGTSTGGLVWRVDVEVDVLQKVGD